MALRQIVPPAGDPITLVEALDYLKVEPGVEDQLISQLIETATLAVEAFTGRALMRQQWEMKINPAFGSAWSDKSFLNFRSLEGSGGIILPKAPFQSLDVAPVILDERNQERRPVKAFRMDISSDQARLHVDAGRQNHNHEVLLVKYWVGYGEDPTDIPAPMRTSILGFISVLYEERDQGKFPLTPVLSPQILGLLSPYRLNINLS